MNLIEFKINFLLQEEKCQVISFDKEGYLVGSCDTLLPLSSYKGKAERIPLPIIDNIHEILRDMPEGEQLIFPRVETDFEGYPTQIFDFILLKQHERADVRCICVIRDYVVRYHHLQKIVTEQRATAMEKEFLEIKHEKTALENELISLKNKELEIARAIKNDFFAKASHELRTPVNGIVGLAEMLIKTASKEQQEYLGALGQVANQLKTVINDLLDLSKLEENKITFEQVDFQLKDVLNSIYLSFKTLADSKKVQISFDISPQIPDYLKGDSTRISQILYNLIGNSLKFTEKGEIKISAEIENISEKKEIYLLHLTVADTGIGIAPDKLVQIFEPYSQESNETYRIYGGTGLGLTIVKQLIEAMGGTVSVQSIQGKGTTFHFSIPLALGAVPQIATDTSFRNYHNYHLLIADDNNINLLVITKKMQDIGFEVDTVSNGQEALDTLSEKKYDILFLDVDMPLLDGYQTTQKIRAMPDSYYQQLPIFLMTAYSYTDIEDKVKEIGISDFLTKPFEMRTLLQKLKKHLPASKTNSEQSTLNLVQINEFTQGDTAFEKILLTQTSEAIKSFEIEYKEAIYSPTVEKSIHDLLHKYNMVFVMLAENTLRREVESTVEVMQKAIDQKTTQEKLSINIHLLCEGVTAQLQARIYLLSEQPNE